MVNFNTCLHPLLPYGLFFQRCKDPSHILFSILIYPYLFSSFSHFNAITPECALLFNLVEWAIALHSMYKSALVFVFIF